ncbi:hypothetical protein K523DRAFT_325003, partial [Schizophyllum commune Tattone D]
WTIRSTLTFHVAHHVHHAHYTTNNPCNSFRTSTLPLQQKTSPDARNNICGHNDQYFETRGRENLSSEGGNECPWPRKWRWVQLLAWA